VMPIRHVHTSDLRRRELIGHSLPMPLHAAPSPSTAARSASASRRTSW
jgi:hypothetical protein